MNKLAHTLYITLLLSLCFATALQAQPKREFRAAWIATVANIDWPSKPGLPAVEQQQQFIRRLDQLKAIGCNAVIVQIRSACDAFYDSDYEPWSYYLTGRQGQPPFPLYDPLVFMIAETHKRNMEFHAWFNPYRALMDSKKNANPARHVTKAHPEWIISYGGKSYIDPGIPEARDYVMKVILDVVKRYDIDAVHMDDYFYPYRIAGVAFGDQRSYARYGAGMDKDNWRRDNVNKFVEMLNKRIKQTKPYVKFGISPFGVWRNASKDPEGSNTRGGQTNYDDLYADVLLWLRKGWVDYMLPQLYWEHHHNAAPFEVLLPWWNAHSYERHVYYGLGLYRMAPPVKAPWNSPNEILSQIQDIRDLKAPTGYSFYSSSIFDKIPAKLYNTLGESTNKYPALPPAMPWIDNDAPNAPTLKAIPSSQGTLLQWQASNPTKETQRYAIYRFVNGEDVNITRADKLLTVESGSEYLDVDANRYKKCTYVVTALDRLWNESTPSNQAVTTLK